ncbi:hypothetical protein M8C21_009319, partial [Ambrosia artemisiifolia]
GETSSSSISAHPCRIFSLAEIKSATNNFDDEFVIGQGGFGKVYKGRISSEEAGDLVRLPLVTKVKILVGIAQGIVFLQNPIFNNTRRKVSESELDRRRILLDEDFTVKLSGYDSGHYNLAEPDIDGLDLVLECNLSGYKVIFVEGLTGKRIYRSNRVAKINRFFRECGKESLDRITETCWEICNEVDSESKMLTMLKEHDKLIHERLESWLNDPQN